jgi:hypothetical protein
MAFMPPIGLAKPIPHTPPEEKAVERGKGYVYFPRNTVILYPGDQPFKIINCVVDGPPYTPFPLSAEEAYAGAFDVPDDVVKAARVILDYFGSGSQSAYA